jgi:hypothetical protein
MNGDRIAVIAATLPLFVFGAGGNYEQPDPLRLATLVAAIAGLAAAATRRRWAGSFVLAAVLALAAYYRINAVDGPASDVMLTTNEAVGVLFSGANPYTHAYALTNPPGGPFGYPPGEIVFYGIAHALGNNLFRVDVACSILSMFLIASLGLLAGTGLAAVAVVTLAWTPDVIFHLTDGSNDNAAAFLVLAGFVFVAWSLAVRGRTAVALWWLSAIAFGWSIAFKEYALPIAAFVALFLWRRDARTARRWIVAAAITFGAFVLPFFIWNPVAFVQNVGGALILHSNVWGRNVWHDAVSYTGFAGTIAPAITLIMLLIAAALAAVMWRRPARSVGTAFLQGVSVVAAMFIFARWTTSVYYMFLLPLLMGGVALAFGEETPAAD